MTGPAGIVLVGGQSARMGTDKASLVVDGAAMADHVAGVLHAAGITSVLRAGSAEVPDPHKGEGPLGGVVAGWTRLRLQHPDPVVVVSCDLPSLTVAVIEELVRRSHDSRFGAVAHDGRRPQPLIAAYRPEALTTMVEAYHAGERSVRRCFAPGQLVEVPFESAPLIDADEPADLDGFEVAWPDESGRTPSE